MRLCPMIHYWVCLKYSTLETKLWTIFLPKIWRFLMTYHRLRTAFGYLVESIMQKKVGNNKKLIFLIFNVNSFIDREAIKRDIRSRLWFTYRKNFVPIGGFGSSFTSDKGWGCMLRCGQMVLGQALINLHLGKIIKTCYLHSNCFCFTFEMKLFRLKLVVINQNLIALLSFMSQ